MHCLRIRHTRHSVFTCSYAVNFGLVGHLFLSCKRVTHHAVGVGLIMAKGNEN